MYFKINVLSVLIRFLKTLKNRFGQCIFKDHTLSKIVKNPQKWQDDKFYKSTKKPITVRA